MNPYESPTHCEAGEASDWGSVVYWLSILIGVLGIVIALPVANVMLWIDPLTDYSFAALVIGLLMFAGGYLVLTRRDFK